MARYRLYSPLPPAPESDLTEHRQPVTMRGRGRATVLDDLPDWIVVEEILVRLPPKDLLRCRAVRKCWNTATSTDEFILDHHRRQPLLPILSHAVDQRNSHLFVPRDTAGAGKQRFCLVLQSSDYGILRASLDGLLIVAHGPEFFMCNPVTRKCAPVAKPPSPQGFHHHIDGFYRHQPSGEYRVLWGSSSTDHGSYNTNYQTFYYVLAVGSDNPRCIRQGHVPRPVVSSPSLDLALRNGLPSSFVCPPLHHHGSLHWIIGNNCIMVFNTASETFRLMCRPAQLDPRDLSLLEIDDTLTLCNISTAKDTIDFWEIQDYDAGTWFLKHRINLSGVDPSPPVDSNVMMFSRMAVLNEGELLVQFTPRPWRVLRYDIHGKFLGYLKNGDDQEISLWITKHYLQESVIPLPPFYEMKEEDGAVQEPSFFSGL